MTLDEELLDLFAIDPLPLLAPWYPQAELPPADRGAFVDLVALVDLRELPVMAGAGFPRLWENIDDVIGGAGDLLNKVGDIIWELWDSIWAGIGGGLRWVWDHVNYGLSWLKNTLLEALDLLEGFVTDSLEWVTDTTYGLTQSVALRVWDAAVWLKEQLSGPTDWIVDQIEDSFSWTLGVLVGAGDFARDQVGGAFGWVWGKIEAAKDWTWDHVNYGLMGLWNWVDDRANWLSDRVWDAAEWTKTHTVDPILGGVADIVMELVGGFVSLGDKIGDLAGLIGEAIQGAFSWLFEHSLEPIMDVFARKLEIPGKVVRGEIPSLAAFVDELMDPPSDILKGLQLFVWAVVVIVPSLIMGFVPAFAPVNERWAQELRTYLPDALLSRVDLQEARWRELDVDVEDQLARSGYSAELRQIIAELDKRIPGPVDLVRMAVREAFDRSKAEALGYVTDLPGEFALWMKRQGFDEEWSNRYWWAHWTLPSVGQGMEMFWRVPDFDEDQLRLLLTVLDIPPLWHDRLVQIAYQPVTRVDIRRLYKLGLITTDRELIDRHVALGYSPEDAAMMSEFVKKYAVGDEEGELSDMRDLSVSSIRLAYRRHTISREEALELMVDAGYTEDVADFYLTIDDVQLGLRPDLDADVDVRELTTSIVLKAYRLKEWDADRVQRELEDMGYVPGSAALLLRLEDLQEEDDLLEVRVKLVRERFLAFEVTEGVVRSELADLGLHEDRIELLVRDWTADRMPNVKRLTSSQVIKAVRDEVFSGDEGLAYLVTLGYSPEDAEVLMMVSGVGLSQAQIVACRRRGIFSDSEAVAALRRLGLTEDAAVTLLEIAPLTLSVSQVSAALKKGLLTEDEALERLMELGYTEADALLILEIRRPEEEEEEERPLTVAQITRLLKEERITEAEALERLMELGYREGDAQLLIASTLEGLS